MSKIKKTLFAGKKKYLALGLALLVIPGSAYAAWTITGHGQGQAKVGTLQTPTMSQAAAVGTLLPGSTTGVRFDVTNPNGAALEVYAVENGDGTGSSSSPTCTEAYLQVVPSTLATPVRVDPGTTSIVVPDAFRLAPDSPTSCQNETLTKDVKLLFRTPVSGS